MKSSLQKITDPDLPLIQSAYDALRQAVGKAIERGILLGSLLAEKKSRLEAEGYGQWSGWLKKNLPELSDETARRYIRLAEVAQMKALGDTAIDVPFSRLLSAPESDLSAPALTARQMVFEWSSDKTIKDALGEVVVGGDEPHRVVRAHNGKQHGGYAGEDRKDIPKFVAVHLSDISSHLGNWKKLKPAQIESLQTSFALAVDKWPTPLLETLRDAIKETLKTR